jgi:hypothetical protein
VNYPFSRDQLKWSNNLNKYEPKDTVIARRTDIADVTFDKPVNVVNVRKSMELTPCRRSLLNISKDPSPDKLNVTVTDHEGLNAQLHRTGSIEQISDLAIQDEINKSTLAK